MDRRTRLIVQHIFGSLLLSLTAGVVAAALLRPLNRLCAPLVRRLTALGHWELLGLIVLVFAIIGFVRPRAMLSIVKSLRAFPSHFGLIVKVILGLVTLLTLLLVYSSDLIKAVSLGSLVATAGYCALGVAVGHVVARFITTGMHNEICCDTPLRPREESNSPDDLVAWLVDDRPIVGEHDSRLPDHIDTAERILDRLVSGLDPEAGPCPGVALIGPYGSGKTSICNLVQSLYARKRQEGMALPRVLFRRFEAWQYLTPEAAIRGLMESAAAAVEEVADIPELWRLPEKYVNAIKQGASGWTGAFVMLLGGRAEPRAVLSRISDALVRLGIRLVIFMDDFDRVEGTASASQGALAQALNHFQNLPNIQYVISVGSPTRRDLGPPIPGPAFDLLKLTRFQELVPRMDAERSLGLIQQLRACSLSKENYYPWAELGPRDEDPLKWNRLFTGHPSGLAGILAELLSTPRTLKGALRDALAAWRGGLDGEISWYDLMLACVLRIAEPAVFEWIERERELFLSGPGLAGTTSSESLVQRAEEARKEIAQRVQTRSAKRIDAVTGAIKMLFPAFASVLEATENRQREIGALSQPISYDPLDGRSTLEKFLSGKLAQNELPDQPTLQYIRDLLRDGCQATEFHRRYTSSFEKLTGPLNTFVQFSGLLTTGLALQVADAILEWVAVPAHAQVWLKPGEYVHALVLDVYFIITGSGKHERRGQIEPGPGSRGDQILDWLRSVAVAYTSSRPLVAIETLSVFSPTPGSTAFSFRQEQMDPLWQGLAQQLREHFVDGDGPLLPGLGPGRSDLFHFNSALRRHDRYEDFRTAYTERLVAESKADNRHILKSKIIISLVSYSHPVTDGEPPVESYEFSVNQQQNEAGYDMQLLLPTLREWVDIELPDPVAQRAFEHLDQVYALPH